MDFHDPGKLAERGFKTVALTFCMFMHYVVTMLVYFIPIDVAAKIFGIPMMPAILIGCIGLYLWSMLSAHLLLKSYERINKNDNKSD